MYDKTKLPDLWEHQIKAKEALRDGFRNGHKRQLLMMPTGSGKTITSFDLIHGAMEKGKRAMFICDLNSLINQTSQNAMRYGLGDHGIIQGDNTRYTDARFVVASAQTLESRGFPENPPDLIVIDEAHIKRQATIDYILKTNVAVVGLSATPYAPWMGDVFSNLVNATTMGELTENGVLTKIKILACTPIDMEGAKTQGGEWTDKAREERSIRIVGDVVEEWHNNASELKTILFASTIAECEAYTGAFNNAGVLSCSYTSRTSEDEGREIMEEFAKLDSDIRVLLSVGRLTRGFDVPNIECGIDVRPLRKSLSEFTQKIGRVVRSAPGKDEALWLDHAQNVARFMPDFEQIYFNGLDSLKSGSDMDKKIRKEPEEKEPVECPECGHAPFFKRCIRCGYEKKAKSMEESAQGKMIEIKIGNRIAAKDNYDLYAQLVTYANYKGYKPGWASFLYKDITGEMPKNMPSPELIPQTEITNAVYGKIKQKNIAYRKATGR